MNGELGPPLHFQKAVVARLIGFQALAPQLSRFESLDAGWVGRSMADYLSRATDQVMRKPDSDESLPSFLGNLVTQLESEVARILETEEIQPSSEIGETVDEILQELWQLVKDFCASPTNPLWRLVTAIERTAADFYDAYGTSIPEGLWTNVKLIPHINRDKVSLTFASDINLQTRTKFGAGHPSSAQVFLTLSPRWLDVRTIAALPRVLLHEYFSHVPQGPHDRPRMHPDADDSFAEGWMDYVAHQVHRAVLYWQGPSQELRACLIEMWFSIYESAAERFHETRCTQHDYDPCAAARWQGAYAAQVMHNVLQRLVKAKVLDTTATADELLYRLSFDINVSSHSSIERRLFVADVLRSRRRGSRSDALVPALRRWAVNEITLEELLASLRR